MLLNILVAYNNCNCVSNNFRMAWYRYVCLNPLDLSMAEVTFISKTIWKKLKARLLVGCQNDPSHRSFVAKNHRYASNVYLRGDHFCNKLWNSFSSLIIYPSHKVHRLFVDSASKMINLLAIFVVPKGQYICVLWS